MWNNTTQKKGEDKEIKDPTLQPKRHYKTKKKEEEQDYELKWTKSSCTERKMGNRVQQIKKSNLNNPIL